MESEKPARNFAFADGEDEFMKNCFLLTSKPVIYAANIKEDDMGKDEDSLPHVVKVKEFAAKEGAEVLVICAKTEEELSQIDKMYLKFGEKLESEFLSQSEFEDRTIEQTLDLGWKVLSLLPKSELYRIKPEYIEKYMPKE